MSELESFKCGKNEYGLVHPKHMTNPVFWANQYVTFDVETPNIKYDLINEFIIKCTKSDTGNLFEYSFIFI